MSSKLRSRLIWRGGPATAAEAPLAVATVYVVQHPGAAQERPDFLLPVSPHERAVRFLFIGSEIEHALMAQYLYAAYSLNEDQPDEQKRALIKHWKSVVLEVAREEMGHLATVQNMLTLIGGPLCFERDDYPILDPDLFPFPFQLERLTKNSLGKYVLAEMPSEAVLKKLGLTDEFEEIKHRVHAADELMVHRVGLIYEEIIRLFTAGPMIQGPIVPDVTDPHPFVATVDIQADNLKYQVSASAWGLGYKDILIEVGYDRTSALAAIQKISIQGEGPLGVNDTNLEEEFKKSHCYRFLAIYREFPEDDAWQPSRPVATNPTTDPDVDDPSRRIEGLATSWAALANLRYRMLLLYLKHSFYIESSSGSPLRSPKGALVSFAFGEMYNVRSLAEILMNLPLRPSSAWMAGPPFEMPYTLALPARSVDRWRTHRDLLTASIELVDRMVASNPTQERYLRALRVSDETTLEQVTALIGA